MPLFINFKSRFDCTIEWFNFKNFINLNGNQHQYTQETAIKMMNSFGATATPFLFIIDFECQNPYIIPLQCIDYQEVRSNLFATNYAKNRQQKSSFSIDKRPISFSKYQTAFDNIQQNIHVGNSFLVNLTCQTPISLPLSLLEIYEQSTAKYKLWLKNKFVCFSPETFVKIDADGKISSFPMKGTIEANNPKAAQILLNDKKEYYEHTTIVDLIRNDLSRISEKVWVEKFRYLDTIQKEDGTKLLQVSSQINGLLSSNWRENLGDIMFKLLPAGSISGAPKSKTIELIKHAETMTYATGKRDFYTGIFGYFDGSKLDSGVMIRFIEETPEGLVFKSGGGITANSIAEREYEEMIQKIYVPII